MSMLLLGQNFMLFPMVCESNTMYRKMYETIHRNCVLYFQHIVLSLQKNKVHHSKER